MPVVDRTKFSAWAVGMSFHTAFGPPGLVLPDWTADWAETPDEGTKTALVLDGANDDASTPDHADFDITSDIDLRVAVAMNDWTPVFGQGFIDKPTSYFLGMDGDKPTMYWNTSLISSQETATVAPTVSNGDGLLLRATLDVDDGSGNHVVTFYTKAFVYESVFDDIKSHDDWAQLGDAHTNAGTTSIDAGTNTVRIGSENGTSQFLAGDVYAACIYNGIAGTAACEYDLTSDGSLTDTQGHTWTLNNGAAFSDPNSLDITSDIDMRGAFLLTDYTPASGTYWFIDKKSGNTGYRFGVEMDGSAAELQIEWGTGAASLSAESTVGLNTVATDGVGILVRATLDVASGANRVINFYYRTLKWPTIEEDIQSDTGWEQLGTTVTTAGTTSISSNTAVMKVGDTASAAVNGIVYAICVMAGIDGEVRDLAMFCDADARTDDYTDEYGHVWSVNGDAYFQPNVVGFDVHPCDGTEFEVGDFEDFDEIVGNLHGGSPGSTVAVPNWNLGYFVKGGTVPGATGGSATQANHANHANHADHTLNTQTNTTITGGATRVTGPTPLSHTAHDAHSAHGTNEPPYRTACYWIKVT